MFTQASQFPIPLFQFGTIEILEHSSINLNTKDYDVSDLFRVINWFWGLFQN